MRFMSSEMRTYTRPAVGSHSPWRTAIPLPARLQNSHQNGGRIFLIFVADPTTVRLCRSERLRPLLSPTARHVLDDIHGVLLEPQIQIHTAATTSQRVLVPGPANDIKRPMARVTYKQSEEVLRRVHHGLEIGLGHVRPIVVVDQFVDRPTLGLLIADNLRPRLSDLLDHGVGRLVVPRIR